MRAEVLFDDNLPEEAQTKEKTLTDMEANTLFDALADTLAEENA